MMNTANLKTALVALTILVASLCSTMLYADCDIMAMIAKYGHTISEYGTTSGTYQYPVDYFEFMMARSTNTGDKPNPNGYGLIFYPRSVHELYYTPNLYDLDNNCWYLVDEELTGYSYYHGSTYTASPSSTNNPMNFGYNIILNQQGITGTEAEIVIGNDRLGTGGVGSHPFRFDWNGITYTFVHNGGLENSASYTKHNIKRLLFNELDDADWFETYESNWEGTSSDYTTWIDSEILFHWIMKNIIDNGGTIITGIHDALTAILIDNDPPYWTNETVDLEDIFEDPYYTDDINSSWVNCINFIFSDGNAIYSFKNGEDAKHTIFYRDDLTGFYALNSYINPSVANSTEMDKYDFAYFPKHGDCFEIDDFICDDSPITVAPSTISTTTNWSNIVFIDDDVDVINGAILNIQSDCIVEFGAQYTFTIDNGTVNLGENAEIRLLNASEIIIDGPNSALNLYWGSKISGNVAGYYIGETYTHGDRIIAQNGGKITTKTDIQYLSDPGPTIYFYSTSDELWDGIFIKNPADEDEFWFVNCDIASIRKLSIENIGETEDIANLNLYLTDFHDAGQLVVRDGHVLTIDDAESEEYCNFQNNIACPIYAYESPVFLDYVQIGGNGDGNNGAGIYIYNDAQLTSSITHCNFVDNNGYGFIANGTVFSGFNLINIEENTGFGMLCYDGTSFVNDQFTNILIRNNDYAEYVGWQETFEMEDYAANITIAENNYGTGSDAYLLMNVNWDEETEVDIRGTNITSVEHLYPTNTDAWRYSPQITGAGELLTEAEIDFANCNYDGARLLLYQLLDEYLDSPEANTAVFYLYHIEVLTDEDYSSLITYLSSLDVDEESKLYLTIEKVKAKSLIKDGDYLAAIDILENIIINCELPDEVVSAMIDEGYCYLELADQEERCLPTNCTVKTATLEDYQATVNELQTQFSFYPDEGNENITPVAGNIISVTNYPNPFNPTTNISFNLSSESDVSLSIYNVKGQMVKQLVNEQLSAGSHTIEWNGKDSNNKSVSSGIYYYKVSSGKDTVINKMLLLK